MLHRTLNQALLRKVFKWTLIVLACLPFGAAFLLALAPYIVVGFGGLKMMQDNAAGKPLYLESEVTVASPDKRILFVAKKGGTCYLLRTSLHQIIQKHRISTSDYSELQAVWLDNRHVRLDLGLRYPTTTPGTSTTWEIGSKFPDTH